MACLTFKYTNAFLANAFYFLNGSQVLSSQKRLKELKLEKM